MTDRSEKIFGNPVSRRDYDKAQGSKQKYINRFGDDSGADYPAVLKRNEHIGDILGVRDIRVGTDPGEPDEPFDEEKGIIIGNIRMGFGHYRIAMAMASAAQARGYVPYWMDLNSYPETTCTKVISAQNDLYSLGSRVSQKSRAFNKVFWEPMNYEGFRKLSYNASDQKNAELMAPVFKNVPKDLPFIGTHVWPSQAALHAGMKYVVNAIPDNWPMALHLAEGSVHTIQTRQAWQGYRILNGMQGRDVLKPMPAESLVYTGHYIDHELVSNIGADCAARVRRHSEKCPTRFLLTIGGAGAQKEIFRDVIKRMMVPLKKGRAALYVNVGDYREVWDELIRDVDGLAEISDEHFNDWTAARAWSEKVLSGETGVTGVHAFWHENIFEAVYCTNMLMRICDVLVTKPSELAFYPVPKLFIRHIGGHERWGAIHSAEMGDGTLECEDTAHIIQMMKMFMADHSYLADMCGCICENAENGLYDGAYRAVDIAMDLKNNGGKS